jgi:DNA-binding transcriptional regulator YiaG
VKSLCPCSKSISKYGAHNQRSLVDVQIRSSEFIWIEDVIELVEKCASAPLFALLKREDEKYITELAYENPKFVEDLVRDAVLSLRDLPGVQWLHVAAENHESIHNHSAYAEIEWSLESDANSEQVGMTFPPLAGADTDATPFGEWLSSQRQSRAYSQQDFAQKLEVSPAHLSRVEAGEKRLSDEVLTRVAQLLGHDPSMVMLRAGVIPSNLLQAIANAPQGFIDWANQTSK